MWNTRPWRWLSLASVVGVVVGCTDAPQPLAPDAPALDLSATSVDFAVYSNFGPYWSFDAAPMHRFWIGGSMPGVSAGQSVAERFVPSTSAALQDISLPIASLAGADSLRLSLHADSGGGPGPVLESWLASGFSFGGAPVLFNVRSRYGPVLVAGRSYWLSAVAAPGTEAGWFWNSIGDAAPNGMAFAYSGRVDGPWAPAVDMTRGAFHVNGIPPAYRRKSFTLDDITLLTPPIVDVGGSPLYFVPTISNRTLTRRAIVTVESWIEQSGARRSAGTQRVTCGLESGVLPPGTCVRTTTALTASNSSPGTGTFVDGPAIVIVKLVLTMANGTRQTLNSRTFPITLQATPASVIGVSFATPSVTIPAPGGGQLLHATVQATGGADTTLAWSSSAPWIIAVSPSGMAVAVAPGAAIVTAMSLFDPSKSASVLVTVGAPPYTGAGVMVAPGLLSMSPGQQLSVAALVLGAPQGVTWSSSNTMYAVVSSQGSVTAVAPGGARIRATSKFDPTKYADILLSVAGSPAIGSGLAVSPGTWAMHVGQTTVLAVQGLNTPLDAYWMSSNAMVVPVSAMGNVTGTFPGSATITITSKSDPSKTVSSRIDVFSLPFVEPAAPVAVSTGATLPAVNPLSVPIAIGYAGPSGTTTNPFTRVDFQVMRGGLWVTVATQASPLVTDNGVTRNFTWSATWTPGTTFGVGPASMRVVALHTSGAPVVTPISTLITLTNP